MPPFPRLLAILGRQDIAGDDALLHLARERLAEEGLGGEFYPDAPADIGAMAPFVPPGLPSIAHLPRHINPAEAEGRDRVMEFARAGAGRLYGLTVHDHAAFQDHPRSATDGLHALDRELASLPERPLVFVEYAVGMPLEIYLEILESVRAADNVGACLDISHVALAAARERFAESWPGEDALALTPDSPGLEERMEALAEATRYGAAQTLLAAERLAALGKPLHFHLHDGHPLSTYSPYGICDHLSFLHPLPLPFAWKQRRSTDTIFGPERLRSVVRAALGRLSPEKVSFMLEIHPQPGWSPPGRYDGLFAHWEHKENAGRMNYWLDRIVENAKLLRWAVES